LLYSALFAIALAYIIWNHGVRKLGSTKTAVFGYITPLVAMLVAWPTLGEIPTLGQMAGAVVTISGLYLVRTGLMVITKAPAPLSESETSVAPV